MYPIYGKEVGEPVLLTPEQIKALLKAKEGEIGQKKNSKPGWSLTKVARDFIRSIAVSQRCVGVRLASLALAKEAEEVAHADDLLSQVVNLQAKALAILEKAEKDDDLRTALMAVREAKATIELVAKITSELIHKQETSLKTDVQRTFVIGEGYVDNDEWKATTPSVNCP